MQWRLKVGDFWENGRYSGFRESHSLWDCLAGTQTIIFKTVTLDIQKTNLLIATIFVEILNHAVWQFCCKYTSKSSTLTIFFPQK